MKNTMIKPSFLKRIYGLFSSTERNLSLQKIQKFYNRTFILDADYCKSETRLKIHSQIGTVFENSQEESILEIGCGPGRYAAALAGLGMEVYALDPHKFDEWDELSKLSNIKFLSGFYAEKLPFEDGGVDNICCLGALLYFSDPAQALSEMHRVLRPEGTLLLRTVNKFNNFTNRTGSKLDPSSKNLYSKYELESLIKNAGFSIIHSYTFGYWPSNFTNLFWYISNCFMSSNFKEGIGEILPEENRILITVVAKKSGSVGGMRNSVL